jgi:hypothetical protein
MKETNDNLRFFPLSPNFAYMLAPTPISIKPLIDKKVNEIKADFSKQKPYNEYLAGHIDHEYELDYPPEFHEYLGYLFSKFCDTAPFIQTLKSSMSQDKEFILDIPNHGWINFQQKHEYNPMHVHDGILSYVLWYKIPYTIEDETKYGAGSKEGGGRVIVDGDVDLRRNVNGQFEFIYPIDVNVSSQIIPVDKSWEGTIAVFPSNLNHQVYPFYTSNDYRITMSGNCFFHTQ